MVLRRGTAWLGEEGLEVQQPSYQLPRLCERCLWTCTVPWVERRLLITCNFVHCAWLSYTNTCIQQIKIDIGFQTVNIQRKLVLGSPLFMNYLAAFLWMSWFFCPRSFNALGRQSSLWFIHWACSVMTQAYIIREISSSECKDSDLEKLSHRKAFSGPALFWGPGGQCLISQKLASRNSLSGKRKWPTNVEKNALGDIIVEESWMCRLICWIWENEN